jgi:predicted alpha/beta superfamily hydrolase
MSVERILSTITTVIVCSTLSILSSHAPCIAQEDGASIDIGQYRKIHSRVLNEDRMLLIHLPRGYEDGTLSYPVLYLLYGGQVTGYFAESVNLLHRLSGVSEIPAMILVGIANTDRYRDMLPVLSEGRPGGSDNFLKFFAEELIPFVEKSYRTKEFRILVGPQAGATFALYAILEKPDLFGAAIVHNPFGAPSSRDLMIRKAEELIGQAKPFKKFLFVTYRHDDRYASKDLEYLYRLSNLIETGKPQDLDFRLNYLKSSKGFMTPLGLKEGLQALYPDYELPVDGKTEGLSGIKEYYDALSKRYGYAVDIPEFVLTRQSDDLMERGKTAAAVEVLEYMIEEYPDSVNGYWRLANYHREKGNTDLAIRYYRKCVELYPDIAPARRWLEVLEKDQGDS